MNAQSQEHPRYLEVKTAMLVHVPFFSSLLFDIMDVQIGKFPHIFGSRKPTAATDGKHIYVDADYLSSLKLPQAVFLFCHEIGHAMWLHMPRAKHYQEMGFEGEPFDPRRWNFAGDYVINDMLVVSQIGKMPEGGLLDKRWTHNMFIDDVYRDLKDKMPPRNGGGNGKGKGGQPGQGQPGQGDADDANDGTMDTHIYAPGQLNEAEMKRAVQTACDAAKAMGKLPQALERYATSFLKPVVRWQDRLRHHVMRSISRDALTWTRPHRRRLVSQGLYLPAYTGFGAGFLVVAIDTSGSISQAELDRFFSELQDIIDTCHPTGVVLLGCDAAVSSEHFLEADQNLKEQNIKLGGGGGTSFIPVFDWVREHAEDPACLVYFTDMYGSFPQEAPHYPVIWCATTKEKAPWGETVVCREDADE